MYARGLSVRDIEAAFRDVTGASVKVLPVPVAMATSIWRLRFAIASSIAVLASLWYGRRRGWRFGLFANQSESLSTSRESISRNAAGV
jgi:hypothetical protein